MSWLQWQNKKSDFQPDNMNQDDPIIFAEEAINSTENYSVKETWKIAIVDDEPDVHAITRLALRNARFENRGFEFLSAHSAVEAQQLFQDHSDIALCILDVVMETPDAGLRLVNYIRKTLNNHKVRIVLRTGQAGQAPEEEIISEYDINDYKEKTELSATKLQTLINASLRSYRDIIELETFNKGLRHILRATTEVYREVFFDDFSHQAIQQAAKLLNPLQSSTPIKYSAFIAYQQNDSFFIAAGTGQFQNQFSRDATELLAPYQAQMTSLAANSEKVICHYDTFVFIYSGAESKKQVVFLECQHLLSPIEQRLLNLYCHNILKALENVFLKTQLVSAQMDFVYLLGNAIENRCATNNANLKRVADIVFLLAKGMGVDNTEAELIKIASTLKDIGKLFLPEELLQPQSELDEEQKLQLRTHTIEGEKALLARKDSDLTIYAAQIARQHHERWDGSGYPDGRSGLSICIGAQIVGLVDDFDALARKNNCRAIESFEEVYEYIKSQSGILYSNQLVGVLMEYRELIQMAYNLNPIEK